MDRSSLRQLEQGIEPVTNWFQDDSNNHSSTVTQ